jgi:shikimate dehydrogenase
MFEIKDERKNIDNIDNMIFDLLVKRLNPVMKIGEIKSKNNIPIEDSKREDSIYARIDARFSQKEAKYLKEIYHSVISASKKIERNEL